METQGFQHEDRLAAEIRNRIKTAGEMVWQRYPLPWTHPGFKSCPLAAGNLLRLFDRARTFLVMRDQCLGPVRDGLQAQGRNVVVPTRHGAGLLAFHKDNTKTHESAATTPSSRPTPTTLAPRNTRAFYGSENIDVVVVACLAYSRHETRLYSLELERTAYLLDELYSGLPNGWRLSRSVPVVCIAADQQEVHHWPGWARGYVRANLVVTPTRVIALGSGEEAGLAPARR